MRVRADLLLVVCMKWGSWAFFNRQQCSSIRSNRFLLLFLSYFMSFLFIACSSRWFVQSLAVRLRHFLRICLCNDLNWMFMPCFIRFHHYWCINSYGWYCFRVFVARICVLFCFFFSVFLSVLFLRFHCSCRPERFEMMAINYALNIIYTYTHTHTQSGWNRLIFACSFRIGWCQWRWFLGRSVGRPVCAM